MEYFQLSFIFKISALASSFVEHKKKNKNQKYGLKRIMMFLKSEYIHMFCTAYLFDF